MESRKYQLQQQIIEALKANDNDLYSLLKSQWAHRFGVESLEELKKLDLSEVNQNPTNEENQKIDQLQENFLEGDKSISIKHDDSKEKVIKNDNNKEIDSVDIKKKESFEVKSYQIVDKENHENKALKPRQEHKTPPKVQALIPLPPKPKYSYLGKWLLRSNL